MLTFTKSILYWQQIYLICLFFGEVFFFLSVMVIMLQSLCYNLICFLIHYTLLHCLPSCGRGIFFVVYTLLFKNSELYVEFPVMLRNTSLTSTSSLCKRFIFCLFQGASYMNCLMMVHASSLKNILKSLFCRLW